MTGDSPSNGPTARISAVQEDIVRLRLTDPETQAMVKNEVVYVRPARNPDERLKAEVLRISGDQADAQVYESTGGIELGDGVEQSGRLLSVSLGPGLLGQVYDGLQNPLEPLAVAHGTFLPRGIELPGLDSTAKWAFSPSRRIGEKVTGGDTLGTVPEGVIQHKIMVPFDIDEEVELTWLRGGSVTVEDPVARLRDAAGVERTVTLRQDWPVRLSLPRRLIESKRSERLYPDTPMITSQRLIDTFFPIAQGGTACIPGPFGAGKTVLQNLISRHADVDVVIVVACGERAGEVVETITEFPRLRDPRTGGSLMDRTVIICNTSSMPVASREASIYTGLTIGEYYRQMGLRTLLIADSTSRWAQAMRETSGRLEEIPGEEGFPAYLDSSIKGVYERAGLIRTNDGSTGALTMIGTVSPAGGNFEEPVTQSTLSAVKCFLGLSADRAYKRFYPAVDPLLSWSRYREQLAPWFAEQMGPDWGARVQAMETLLSRGEDIAQMMQVTGEDGVTLDDFVTYQAALFLDMVFLQQDAFDEVDSSVPLARQKAQFDGVHAAVTRSYAFADKAAVRDYFTRLTGLYKNLNYAAQGSQDEERLLDEIAALDRTVPIFAHGADSEAAAP
ncbi:V-type ATP synthase subunit A [Qingshengfaniella alkalisoli]|uniref:V-type ATP synthase alpha chain n=1 Tax=Qingshengfaniella alkalisoli TaxID=2599296 RepID=A0A5B8J3A2_9RHOB|nr:V-type ATP synthase subunit A [Qingshengfaniella alkalisoli]QDY71198.1 V-type ATP synthase subunit A [Qingshengfaniella alkalisoli]